MGLWTWIAIALSTIAVSALVSLLIARILGRIGHEISEIFAVDMWSAAPLARDRQERRGIRSERLRAFDGRTRVRR
jgi:hypothetical protein